MDPDNSMPETSEDDAEYDTVSALVTETHDDDIHGAPTIKRVTVERDERWGLRQSSDMAQRDDDEKMHERLQWAMERGNQKLLESQAAVQGQLVQYQADVETVAREFESYKEQKANEVMTLRRKIRELEVGHHNRLSCFLSVDR